ncbi:MAG: hypothetical protein EAX89_16830 [Candidatus Lokiarchaeota archaeon]|nr:hypothetical protein [Candidatus Lokiarchaeota archaeon]
MDFLSYVTEKNLTFGIIITCVITFFGFVIYPYFGIFAYGDIYLIIGLILGEFFIFKFRKESQPFIKTGVLAGIGGGGFSSLFITIYVWILYSNIYGYNILDFFIILLNYIVFYVLFGIIIGYLFGTIYIRKEPRSDSLEF